MGSTVDFNWEKRWEKGPKEKLTSSPDPTPSTAFKGVKTSITSLRQTKDNNNGPLISGTPF